MIPTLEDIIRMLARGECTAEQALRWLAAHEGSNAERLAEDRRAFAAMAMQGLLAKHGANGTLEPGALVSWAVDYADDLITRLAGSPP